VGFVIAGVRTRKRSVHSATRLDAIYETVEPIEDNYRPDALRVGRHYWREEARDLGGMTFGKRTQLSPCLQRVLRE